MNLDSQLDNEERLRDALEQTKALYEGAKKAFDSAQEIQKNLGPNHVDGSLRQATRVFRHTQRNYVEALMAFNRFILNRKLPEK